MEQQTMHVIRQAAVALMLVSGFVDGLAAQRDLSPLDVVTMRSVSGVYPSPDGTQIAFTRTEPRTPRDAPGGSFNGLYLLGADGRERPLVADKRNVNGVSWHPNGTLTFLERGELFALLPDAQGPMPALPSQTGIIQYRWRPDGTGLAFTRRDPTPTARAATRERGFRQEVVDEDWNGIGIYLWDEATDEATRLEVQGSVFDLEWSPDGTQLALAVAPRPLVDDSYMFKRIHVVEMETGSVRKIIDNPGKLEDMRWSPDSRHLLYISAVDVRDPHAGMPYIVDVATGDVTELLPNFAGMVHQAAWLEPDRIRMLISRGIVKQVADLSLSDRAWNELPAFDGSIGTLATAAGTVAAVASGSSHPSELYTLDRGMWTRRTNSNPWLDEVELSRQEIYRFTASDGVEIEGVLLYPLAFDADARYPLVIVAHGGPESHYNNQWVTGYSTWGQLLSRDGYFVWYPNYRSSTGRGIAFAKDDHGDLMGREFQDHLDAIAHFTDRGWVDPGRVGIGGGSYGGYTAAWAATRHTEHFAAAVSFVPITHVATKWMTTDIPWEYYYVHYEEQWPHEQWDYLEERSPLTYAHTSRTPLLLLGGTSDTRVHPSQPFMLYRAISLTTETPVRYVRYPGEGHGNRSNVYRYDYVLRTLRWFERYLAAGERRTELPPPLDLEYPGFDN
jgi:dipeptidyl aminopeptidase/acylaminoacyl peptidase